MEFDDRWEGVMDPWEVQSIDYSNPDLLNDSYFIKQLIVLIDNNFNDISTKITNHIATRQNKKTIDYDTGTLLLDNSLAVLEEYRTTYKLQISTISHISDIQYKSNMKTAIIFYDNLKGFITNEIYKMYILTIKYIDEQF
jgi:hypothetical protein